MINNRYPFMRYLLGLTLLTAGVFIACKKTNSTNANILFYNGTWSLPGIGAAWNTVDIITTTIAQGQSSGTAAAPYLQVQAGTNQVTLKSGTTQLLNKNIYVAGASTSSFIFFDTSSKVVSPAYPASILQLTDDLTLPDTARIKYRIINLVPDTSMHEDVWLVNGTTDSVRLDSANTFIGAAASASDVATFNTVTSHGGSYTVKFKKTATEQVYASLTSYPFAVQGIYSIIFSGLLTGTGDKALKLSVLHHTIP